MKFLKKLPVEVKIGLLIFAMVWNGLAFLCGFLEAVPVDNRLTTGCKYESFAAFSPGRVVACELFRKRF